MTDIVIYGTPSCTYCEQAKKFLDTMGLEYTYKCIMTDHTAMEEFSQAGNFRTVPQIFIDGEHVGGYSEMFEIIKE